MKRYKIILQTLLLMAWASPPVQAQHSMTLKECMEYAVSHSTKMRFQAADRSDEQWARRQAIMQAFTPTVSAQTYAYNQYGRNLDPESNTYNTIATFHNGFSVSGGITLFDGFQAVNNLRIASVATKMGLSKDQQTRDAICLAVMEAYCNVVYYQMMHSVVEDQVATAETAKNLAARQEELGQKGHADVVRMESELAKMQYQLITTQNKLNEAMLTLKDVMFWPADSSLSIDLSVSEQVALNSVAGSPAESALQRLPAAEIARMNLRQAELSLKTARGAFSPHVGLYGGWSTTYYTYPGLEGYTPLPFADQFRLNGGEYIQLSVSIPIFDQLRRKAELGRKKNALLRAEAEYDQTMRDIENEVARAINDRNGAASAFRQADQMAQLQEEAFRLSAKQYECGIISSIEYQTASQSYLSAVADRTQALLTLQIKNAILRYYNGEPYIAQ